MNEILARLSLSQHYINGNEEGAHYFDSLPKSLIVSWFKKCSSTLRRIGDLDCQLSGSTGVVALASGSQLIIANLGDSRCILGEKQRN